MLMKSNDGEVDGDRGSKTLWNDEKNTHCENTKMI